MEPFAMCLLGAGIMFFGTLMGVVLGRTTRADEVTSALKRSVGMGLASNPVPEEED